MITTLTFAALGLWFAFFLINYAEVFTNLRNRITPFLWARWPGIAYVLSCPLCFAWWCLVGYCMATVSLTPLLVTVPPLVLFIDLAFHKLRDGC